MAGKIVFKMTPSVLSGTLNSTMSICLSVIFIGTASYGSELNSHQGQLGSVYAKSFMRYEVLDVRRASDQNCSRKCCVFQVGTGEV